MTHRPSIEAPQLRTLLLTDLCDSTSLVERIGDVEAATLFRDHDRLVLDLQQRWRGRLIDRSDGLLLLFERPIDGLGFALDYVRELREMGDARRLELRARAGLHVGEVLTWRNSDEAVSVGAKPLEVEGLAKPMAARLMAVARPGQILLSAVAEPLAHRAARELGERGQHLLWKSHGRWRFKGVPDGQQIYEVGEPGIAPLRTPPNTPKAWRDIPLWRRPAALAAEAAIIAGVGVGVWFATRPAPAIAFNQRDWVVVADLRNLTGQAVLDDSLEQAFRISLEQSRYVNVLSDLKVSDTLALMQRPESTRLDRATASEIALRDGARAVVLPTVASFGGNVRFSAEIIDPHTQATVYSASTDGSTQSMLDSIDEVTSQLRGKLGETLAAIDRDSVPLPQVSSKNIDALRAYALGVKAYGNGDYRDALGFYERALELDPEFAIAHLALARTYVGMDETKAAIPHLQAAEKLRAHLVPRDALYLDAWSASLADGDVTNLLEKWKQLGTLYPDYFAGPYNHAWFGTVLANRYREGITGATAAASERNPLRSTAYYLRATLHTALEDYDSAAKDFAKANTLGKAPGSAQVASLAAQRRFDRADSLMKAKSEAGLYEADRIVAITMATDRGRWSDAAALQRQARQAGADDAFSQRLYRAVELSQLGWNTKVPALQSSLRTYLDGEARNVSQTNDPERTHAIFGVLLAGYLAERAGMSGIAPDALANARKLAAGLHHPVLDDMAVLVQAETARRQGKPEDALRVLDQAIDGRELFQIHVARMEALADAGKLDEAVKEAQWIASHRGRAYVENNSYQVLQSLNVADTNLSLLRAAELQAALKRNDAAKQSLQRFDAAWAPDALPGPLAQRRRAVVAAL
ncbi:putative peptide modification system cyclase [Lysobacter sp. MMG2]|nr:putative peptide modification system cyclase [Lysobacter sp. MMG2]